MDTKVILTCAPHKMTSAVAAFDFAAHNSDFSGGFAIIQRGSDVWVVKKNKGGFSVRLSENPA